MRHRLEYLAVRVVAALVTVLPMSAVRALGAGVGRLAYLVDAPHRRIALAELRRRLEILSRPDTPRTPTKPTRASRERRVEAKKRQSRRKAERRWRPDGSD